MAAQADRGRGQEGDAVGGEVGHLVPVHRVNRVVEHDDAGQHGYADGAAKLPHRVEHRRGPAGRRRADGGEGGRLDRDEHLGNGQSQGDHQQPRPPQAGLRSQQGEQADRRGHPRQPHGDVAAGPEPGVEHPAGQLRAGHDAECLGERAQPGAEGAQAAAVLVVQRNGIQGAEEGGRGEDHDPVARAEQAVPQQPQVHDGRVRPQLDGHHGGQQHGPGGDRRQDLRVMPAQVGSLGNAVHQQPEAEPGEQETGQVEAARLVLGGLAQEDRAEGERGRSDRQVDVEHPAPGQLGDEQTAEDRTERGRKRGGHGEYRRGLDPLVRREHAVQHRHPDRGEHAAAGALQDPERDQLVEAGRQPAQRRSSGKQRDRGQQNPLAAVPVTEPAGRRDGDRQAHQEGDDDAVHGGRAHPEVTADGRQRDVDDRRVQDGHEHRGDEDDADRYLLADPRGHSILSPRLRPACGSPSRSYKIALPAEIPPAADRPG